MQNYVYQRRPQETLYIDPAQLDPNDGHSAVTTLTGTLSPENGQRLDKQKDIIFPLISAAMILEKKRGGRGKKFRFRPSKKGKKNKKGTLRITVAEERTLDLYYHYHIWVEKVGKTRRYGQLAAEAWQLGLKVFWQVQRPGAGCSGRAEIARYLIMPSAEKIIDPDPATGGWNIPASLVKRRIEFRRKHKIRKKEM